MAPSGCFQVLRMRHFWSGLPASRTVKRSLPMPKLGEGVEVCPQAIPAHANVATKVVFHLAKAMAPTPLPNHPEAEIPNSKNQEPNHKNTPLEFGSWNLRFPCSGGFLSFFIGPAKPTHQSDFEVSARNAD